MNTLRALVMIVCTGLSLVAGAEQEEQDKVLKPGTGRGTILFANTQKRLPHEEISAVATMIESATELTLRTIVAEENDPKALLSKAKAQAVVVIKDDAESPAMLLAPEDRWATVNVAKLVDDLPAERAKTKFFVPRARKEILRAFSLLCGGGSSQFKGNVMNAASLRDTDRLEERIPADMAAYYVEYMKQLGVTQKELYPYEDACQEGWAPAPTNAVQKAIWEKVHAPPKNPMKIEFDPKKGR